MPEIETTKTETLEADLDCRLEGPIEKIIKHLHGAKRRHPAHRDFRIVRVYAGWDVAEDYELWGTRDLTEQELEQLAAERARRKLAAQKRAKAIEKKLRAQLAKLKEKYDDQ